MILDLTKGNYKNIKVSNGNFKNLPAGAYICEVKYVDVKDTKTKGKQIILSLDICEGEFAGMFEEKIPVTGSFPFYSQLKRYIFDMEKKEYLPGFKGIITMLEKNNPEFIAGDKLDTENLIGLKCGGVYGEKEYLDGKTGKVKISTQLKWLCNIEEVEEGKVKIPPLEKLPDDKRPKDSDIDDFDGSSVPDDDIPF